MGQKVNPVSLRLQYTNRHFDSCWYSDRFYKSLLTRDVLVQNYLTHFLKSLKLPAGRHSVQHLQKKTQIYTFLCVPKSTREWRAKLLGFTRNKNLLKKNRFFSKTKTEYKKRFKKHTKLQCFYKTLNQLAIYRMEKKITSFQNSRLWSGLLHKNHKLLRIHSGFGKKPLFFEKEALFTPAMSQNLAHGLIKLEGPNPPKKASTGSKNMSSLKGLDLLFFQNLVVYKTLKARLLVKNRPQSGPKNAFLGEEATKSHSFLPKKNALTPFFVMGSPVSSFQTLELKYQKHLESSLSSLCGLDVDLMSFKVKHDWQYASFLADEIVSVLEKRIPFRRLKSKLIKQLSRISAIRGVRITCSGRVGGKSKKAQRAKSESLRYGQTSLHVFSAPIDFSCKTARTSFGSVGVKVWICYQENLMQN